MNNLNAINYEQNNQTPFFSRNLDFLGIRIPYWLLILCLIIIVIIIIFSMTDTSQVKQIIPYDFTVTSDSPGNTIIDDIINKNY
ncbi:hypothetical protein Catovirus_1_899 [Catovirus CTV1]|uniref:Uncharacterized protein n=1 Tax=Catovirus CTV1 TaxID=1977631 RepID=A0A1V0SAW8_9VIRU|nr:hypothetical protein Catovirus_1_899 [Catovirus CTV1]